MFKQLVCCATILLFFLGCSGIQKDTRPEKNAFDYKVEAIFKALDEEVKKDDGTVN